MRDGRPGRQRTNSQTTGSSLPSILHREAVGAGARRDEGDLGAEASVERAWGGDKQSQVLVGAAAAA